MKFRLGGDISKHPVVNGKSSNLTHEQWHLVRTPEFKAWFGDWENDPENASKIVDENGEPLVVYHGTKSDFTIFKEESLIWVTSDFKYIEKHFEKNGAYGEKNGVYGRFNKHLEWFCNSKNPLDLSFIGHKAISGKDFYEEIKNKYGVEIKELPLYDEVVKRPYVHISTYAKSIFLNKYGFDGFKIAVDNDSFGIAVFGSNQVKLADGTNAAFAGDNPDIRYDNGGTMKKVKKGGITYGKSHDEGGIPVKNKSTGDALEVEGGEGIVNKRSMASDKTVSVNGKKMSICEAVSALNQMEGGVQFSCDDVDHKQFIEEMASGGELERGERSEREYIDALRKLYEQRIVTSQSKVKTKAKPKSKKMKEGGQAKDNPFQSVGLEKDFAGDWREKMESFQKKSDNFCDVEKKYCASSSTIDRADMPQIYEEYIPQYMDFLEAQGIDSRYDHGVKVADLHPTQKNISLPRIKRTLERIQNRYHTDSEGRWMNPLKRVVVATKDGYLLDGHHRWASSLFLSPNNTLDVLRVEASIKDLVPISKNFGMVQFQKFMFGGKIEADLTLPKVDNYADAQLASRQKSMNIKRGGFPTKGVKVMPIYDGVYSSISGGYESMGYTNGGITFTIANTNLTKNAPDSVATALVVKLRDAYPSLYIISTSDDYTRSSNSTPMAIPRDVSKAIERAIRQGKTEGFNVHTRKFGKTIEISVIPFPDSMALLEDDLFLDNVMDALNAITKFPDSVLPTQEPKDTTKITAPAPTPRFYEPNRKYRFKTGKELEFEFGKKWRERFKRISVLRGNGSMDDYVGDKRYDFVLGKSIYVYPIDWVNFFRGDVLFSCSQMKIPIVGKVMASDWISFSALAITHDGFIEEPSVYDSTRRYRFLTEEECLDKGIEPKEIFESFSVGYKGSDNQVPMADLLLPEMLFGQVIPTAVYEWFKYLYSAGLNAIIAPSNGALGEEWNVSQVFEAKIAFANPVMSFSAASVINALSGEFKKGFTYENRPLYIPKQLENLIDSLLAFKLHGGEDDLTLQALKGITRVTEKILNPVTNQADIGTFLGDLLGISLLTNLAYKNTLVPIISGLKDWELTFAFDGNSPYIKEFSYEEESLAITPKIFSQENILFTSAERLFFYRGSARRSDEAIIDEGCSTYLEFPSDLSPRERELFFGATIPQPIFEYFRYISLISPWYANNTFLGKEQGAEQLFTSAVENIAFSTSVLIDRKASAQPDLQTFPSLSLFEVLSGAGDDGEDLYKWNLDSTIHKDDHLNKTYAPKEYYNLCLFLSNGVRTWTTKNEVDLRQWNIGVDKTVHLIRFRGAGGFTNRNLGAVFFENDWVKKNFVAKPYSNSRSTNSLDLQIEAIQTLMNSFTEDETQVRGYLMKEVQKLRDEREKEIQKSYYSGNLKKLFSLYVDKVSAEQRLADPNKGCRLGTPSGAPSELDLIQYRIIRTEAFKNWFGDWQTAYETKNYNGVSKAINPRTGEPLVFYHGKGNMQIEATKFGFGVFPMKYFGDNYTYANWFANHYNELRVLYEFFVQVKNPMDFSAIGLENITGRTFVLLVEALYGYKIQTPVMPQDRESRMWHILRGNPIMLKEIRDKTDYDGFIIYEDNPSDILPSGELNNTKAIGTFRNEQTKAADGRNTTFFAGAADFRFEKGGLIKNKA